MIDKIEDVQKEYVSEAVARIIGELEDLRSRIPEGADPGGYVYDATSRCIDILKLYADQN